MGLAGGLVRLIAAGVLLWLAGFALFVITLPGPAPLARETEGVAVLTGGPGRVARGVEVLRAGASRRLLVSGVNRAVRPTELVDAAAIPAPLAACCVELGFAAETTRTNADEVSGWIADNRMRSLRLVTASYHMPRAYAELVARVPDDVEIVADGVSAGLPLFPMVMEYAKFQAAWVMLRVRPL
jgi:uncharacterized SAM-binding protein YcdF (DUF218 family)